MRRWQKCWRWSTKNVGAGRLEDAQRSGARVALHRKWALDEPWRVGAKIGTAVIPTLVFTIVIAEILQDKIYLDTSRARRELGWYPKMPLETGLARTVEYFRTSILVPTGKP